MPNAQELIRHYYEDVWAKQSWLQKYGYCWVKTRAEYINICFRNGGHQWLYDFEELDRRLREAGFSRIERAAWGESQYPELRKRETRDEMLLICKATR
jgi:predicted SAM-dependent methyltransferase